jgi:hypothetical protein
MRLPGAYYVATNPARIIYCRKWRRRWTRGSPANQPRSLGVSSPVSTREAPLRPRQENWLRFARKRRSRFLALLLWRLPKAYTGSATVLVDELDASAFQRFFDQFERFWIAGIASNFDVVDRVSMKTRRFCEVSNSPIQCRSCHPDLCTCHSHVIVLLSHASESQVT